MSLMPMLFIGHGSPMNAISKNSYTEGWSQLGGVIPRPKAVLVISAHWYVPYYAVTANLNPPTIHDFGGFPKKLYELQYPAPGSLELAQRLQEVLSPISVRLDETWGLDHGTWSILTHVLPKADIPVVQLSLNKSQSSAFHYELGKKLSVLREEGILILGSGNIVHNLSQYAWNNPESEPFDWAVHFEEFVVSALTNNDDSMLIDYEQLGSSAMLSVPTPEHYLPLLYIMGARRDGDNVSFPVRGIEGASISMLTVKIG